MDTDKKEEKSAEDQEKDKPTDGEQEQKQVTYTQAQLDALFAQRGQQGRSAEQKAILEKTGVKTVDELVTLVEAQRKAKENELSDLEKERNKVTTLESKNADLLTQNKTLKLQTAFNSKVRALSLTFANENAETDAFKALNLEAVGEDHAGLEDEIKRLVKDRAYYFGNGSQQDQKISDGSAKGKINTRVTSEQTIATKRKNITPL